MCSMKKENRKMAQERRAKERRKKELQRKISKIVVIVLPIIAVIALIIAIIVTSGSSKNTTSSGDAAAESGSTDNSTDDSTSYSTDSSLTVEDGDTVNIDYVGSIDGVEFDGGNTQGNGTDLTIGSGRYIDDFEEQLSGAHPGDEVEVTVTFPDDYGNDELNGKEAVFDVTVNGIYQ
ncbi:MAG TPA: FKBP-type peptidyl-prolyl cis-trans isomerase [Candidatus Mediterraneibacter gallistercoris]|uniref:Peptidyl-prolyl cis-trans isomerase n=1 Tax=Candidatus Mediterraneibacter gallistercoris TaxID=2838671 RepID=A0A9D2P4T0_9FIRM|nr:FKBP-type peptidyl-prolyl cis-trans isomerase [Candidatus Mediterraneibacter gallistercoris]